MTTKPLIDYFNKLLPLNKEEQSVVEEVFKEKKLNEIKSEILEITNFVT